MGLSVSSLLEGYLSVYGWQVYASIFLLLVAVGAVLYPVARLVFDAAIGYTENGGDPASGSRSLILRLAIYLLVLVLGLIPVVPVTVSGLTVQNQCGREALTALGQNVPALQGGTYSFAKIQEAKAPLLAYLAMLLASGFNAVMNKVTPCLTDLTRLNLAMNTLDLGQAKDPNSLYAQVRRFEAECGQKARDIAHRFLNDEYGPGSRKFMDDLLERYANGDQRVRQIQLTYFGSKFYQENFYQPCAGGGDPNTPAGKLCGMIAPLRARDPVDGFPYDATRDSDASRYQATHNLGIPTCDQWWNEASHGIRVQLLDAARKSVSKKYTDLAFGRPCRPDLGDSTFGFGLFCSLSNTASDDLLVEQMMLASKRQLGIQMPEVSASEGLFGAALFLFTDVAESIAKQAAGYWVTIYLMKIGASLLQPFLLMSVFMLWGLFLVIGEMRGMTLIKGMLLIFLLSILPSLWLFGEYIDDQLFLLLYPGSQPITNPLQIPDAVMADPSTVERLLLMLVAGAYYLALPLLLLYLIAEAGGPASGPRMASDGINTPAHGLAGIGGSGIGGARLRSLGRLTR